MTLRTRITALERSDTYSDDPVMVFILTVSENGGPRARSAAISLPA